jgi:predicted nucleotidyltransferase
MSDMPFGLSDRPVIGVIAEYNPFHNGHALHLRRAREAVSGGAVVCALSGHVTQRGDFPICSKGSRAAMAALCGADLVLELPAAYACASAERFARAGVFLLAGTGVVTHLSFGSEGGALAPLASAAQALDDPAFPEAQGLFLRRGLSYPAARQRALETFTGRPCPELARPNDTLGIEYLRAVRHWKARLQPVVVPRTGTVHDGERPEGGVASASFVRRLLLEGGRPAGFVPEAAGALWAEERTAGRAPVDISACEGAALAALRGMAAADFARLPDVTEGLEHRLARAARRACSLAEFASLVKTKRYTLARVRRLALWAFLGLPEPSGPPPYLRILAANETGRALLSEMKRKASLPLLSKPTAARRLPGGARACFEAEARVTDLFSLCYPEVSQRVGGQEWQSVMKNV